MAIDPICGMTVDEASALAAERDGQTSYFCSDHCQQKFLSTPATAVLSLCSLDAFDRYNPLLIKVKFFCSQLRSLAATHGRGAIAILSCSLVVLRRATCHQTPGIHHAKASNRFFQ
jgi:YHS domain-containing protein